MDNEFRDRKLWDCDSCLYDSFELRSFKRQIDSAISARSMSMPRLSDPGLTPIAQDTRKKQSKVLRSLQKLIRSVFPSKSPTGIVLNLDHSVDARYLRLGALSTIPESSEKGVESPEFDDSVVQRSVSERFTSSTGGVFVP